ncbi:MAG: AAA family ATPase [Chitinophagaceae bacterium]|nr:AAA family ATPase [Chitinophagaceae bacterium]
MSQETTENKAPADPDFDQLCGLDDVKARIRRELTVFRNMRSAGKKYSLQQLHTVIIGETGTGKSKLVEQLAKIYFRNGITTKPDPVIVQAVNFSEFSRNLAGNIDAARGGILCIENVQQLVSDNSGDSRSTALDRLNAEMQNRDGDPIIILSSRSQSFRNYLEANPDINSRIPLKLYLSDFTVDQMMELACQMLEEEKYSMTDAVKAKLKNRFLYLFKNQMDAAKSLETARNGFLVQKEIKQIIGEHFLNPDYFLSPSALLESDIKGEVYKVRSTEDILRDLDDFVGMEGVREFLQNMINLLRVAKKDAETTGVELTVGAHMVLTGNPGTGKTTLARKLGEVFASAGILSSGHVVDVDRSKLVGQYIGETAQLVQKYCNEAMGGVLLVDEAYSLKQSSSDNVGQEAIDTLLKRMEDDRGKFIVIATGYKQEMQRFINANPGMKSRVKDNFFHLPDYTPPQLLEILKINVKQGQYILTPEAEEKGGKISHQYVQPSYERIWKRTGCAFVF